MSLPDSVIDAMLAAGASAEVIGAAVKAAHAETEKRVAERRAKTAERQRNKRERDALSRSECVTSRDQSVTERYTPSQVSPSFSPSIPTPITTPSSPPPDDDGGGSAREPLVSKSAYELADEVMVIAGVDPAMVPPGWCGAPMRLQSMLTQGWQPEIIKIAVQQATTRKRDGPADSLAYFEKAIAREHAKQAAPLPTVKILEAQETTHVRHASPPANSLVAAGQQRIAELAAWKAEHQPGEGGTCLSGSDPDVRLLSTRGCG